MGQNEIINGKTIYIPLILLDPFLRWICPRWGIMRLSMVKLIISTWYNLNLCLRWIYPRWGRMRLSMVKLSISPWNNLILCLRWISPWCDRMRLSMVNQYISLWFNPLFKVNIPLMRQNELINCKSIYIPLI